MTILFLTKHLNVGGIPRHVVDLSLGLKRRGHEVYVASSGGILEEELKSNNIANIRIPIDTKSELSPRIWFSLSKLLNFVKKEKIDLIHAHTRVTHVLGGILSCFTKIPYLTTCHGIYKIRLNRRIFPFVGEDVIAVSDETAGILIKKFKISPFKIRVIYNGINIKDFDKNIDKDEAKKIFGLNNEDFVIGNTSRLARIKGQDTLIEIISRLKEKGKNIKLFLVGEGEYRSRLLELAHKKNVSDNIVFAGAMKDVRAALKAMDVFCFLSVEEPFGIALLEAMASGLPVIAGSISQIPHILKNGECGILVPPQDVSAAVEKILFLLDNKALMKDLGKKAREYVASEFSLDKTVDSTIKVYEEILSEKSLNIGDKVWEITSQG